MTDDRRSDKTSMNLMQRVFDELRADVGLSIDEIALELRVSRTSVVSALKRLGLQRAVLPASCIDGVWLYRRDPTAIRPIDRRGRRQMAQEIAA